MRGFFWHLSTIRPNILFFNDYSFVYVKTSRRSIPYLIPEQWIFNSHCCWVKNPGSSERVWHSRCSVVYKVVRGVPPFPLSVRGQEAEQRQRQTPRLQELLLRLHTTAELCLLLQLTVAGEDHATQKHLERNSRNVSMLTQKNRIATFYLSNLESSF